MRKLGFAFRLALRAINGYRLRAGLTMLGVTVGVFAITFVFTLVNSMKHSVSKNLAALGNTTLFVHNWPWKDNSEDWYKYFNRPKVSFADYQRLRQGLRDVSGVAFIATKRRGVVKYQFRSVENITVRGVTYDFMAINDLPIAVGRYFTPMETERGRDVCILGYTLARALFGPGPYVGRTVEAAGRRMRVVGVLARQGASLFGENQDDVLLVPYPLITRLYDVRDRSVDKLISIKAASYEKVPQVEQQTTALVRLARGLRPGAEDNFSINKQEYLMDQLGKLFAYLNTGGVIISLFSLLIGGFGIANIMYVSVRERMREIGVQKALGATRGFILQQFLIEAATLCTAGGLAGIIVALGLAGVGGWVSARFDFGLEIVVDPMDVLIGVALSVGIGVVSGLAPSWLAARLDPVEAMRAN